VAESNLKNRILTAQKPILLLVSWKGQTENYAKQQYFQTINIATTTIKTTHNLC
jgi:hypothetical protein